MQGQNQTCPDGWVGGVVGGWTSLEYNYLSPQLRLELGLSLAKYWNTPTGVSTNPKILD